MIANGMKRLGESVAAMNILAVIFYLLAVFYITHPLLFNLGSLSYGLGDELLIAWIHRWVQHSVTTDLFSLFNANIYYPYTNTLAYSETFILTGIITYIPFLFLQEPIATVNIALLISLITLAYSVYLLSFYLTKNFLSSLLSGTLVLFSPTVIEKLVHLQVLSIAFFPLAILFFMRYRDTGYLRYVGYVAICFILQLYTSFMPGYFILLALGIGAVVFYQEKTIQALFNRKIFGILIITGGIILPIILPFYSVSKEFSYVRDIRDTIHFALQPEDLLYPNAHTKLESVLKQILIPPSDVPPGEVKSGYLGAIFTLLAGSISLYIFCRWKSIDKTSKYLFFASLTGLILSLGPFLHLGRHTIHDPFPIPLPYLLGYYLLPGFQGFRNSSRFEMMFIILIAVVIACVVSNVLKNKHKNLRLVLYLLLFIGVIREFNFPIQFQKVPQVHEFPKVYSYINTLPQDAVIIEMPIFVWNMQPYVFAENYREYYSTVHFRKMVNGASGFSPPPWQKMVTELLKTFPEDSSIKQLKQLGVTHIILHKAEYDQLHKDGFTVEGKKIENGEVIFKKLEDSKHISLQQTFGNDYVFTLK